MTPIKKKEMPKIEIKKERQTTEPPAEQFAPIPLTTAPVGQ